MKKIISILAVISCVFALTACSGTQPNTLNGTPVDQTTAQALIQSGEQVVLQMDQIVAEGQTEQYRDVDVLGEALESYQTSRSDIGDIQGFNNEQVVLNDDGNYQINIGIDGSKRDADIVITVDPTQGSATAITTNVQYSFGDLMSQAGMNTVLGMGTTFLILIILALLISCFKFIGKFQNARQKKAELQAEAEEESAPAPAAEETEEEVTDDGELVAVIAAAVAASEGKTTTDGFVVRSIRKARSRF